jgi:hypothetical protein
MARGKHLLEFDLLTGRLSPDQVRPFPMVEEELPLRAPDAQPAATAPQEVYASGVNHHELRKEADIIGKHALAHDEKISKMDPNDPDAAHHRMTGQFLHQYAHDLYRKTKRHALKNGDRVSAKAAHVASGEHLNHALGHSNQGSENV